MENNEIILFTDGKNSIEVQVSPEQDTVWLTQKQIEVLFDVKHATVSEHISNILSTGELDETSVGFSDKSSGGRKPKLYNLDMILSIGYRVNSKRGIAFRRWANSVLKQGTGLVVQNGVTRELSPCHKTIGGVWLCQGQSLKCLIFLKAYSLLSWICFQMICLGLKGYGSFPTGI